MYLIKSANNNKLNTIANIPLINNRGLSRRNNIISFMNLIDHLHTRADGQSFS